MRELFERRPYLTAAAIATLSFWAGSELAPPANSPEKVEKTPAPQKGGDSHKKGPSISHIEPEEADYTTYQEGDRIDEIFNRGNIAYKETVWHCVGSKLVKQSVQLRVIDLGKGRIKAQTSTNTGIFSGGEYSDYYCNDGQIKEEDFKRKPPPQDDLVNPSTSPA